MTGLSDIVGMSVPDAERGVLGVILLTAGRALDEYQVRAEDFSDMTHAAVFTAMQAVHRGGVAVDEITVGDVVPEHSAVVWTYRDFAIHENNMPEYVAIVLNRSTRARYLELANAITALPENVKADQIAALVDRHLQDMPTGSTVQVRTFRDLMNDTVDAMNGTDLFVETPWPSLNKVMGGWRNGKVYVIAARPAEGKSLVALQAAIGLSEHGWVAISSLEMSGVDLVKRAIAAKLSIPSRNVNDATMTALEWERFAVGRESIAELRIAVDADAGATPQSVRRHAFAVQRKGRLSAVVVDYLQLMSAVDKGESRQAVVAEFSRALRLLAKELQVPVIILSQLNRGPESRSDGKPRVSDIRESGAIEQDADVIILLHRDKEEGTISFILAKNRHGPNSEIEFAWEGGFSRISEFGADRLDMPNE